MVFRCLYPSPKPLHCTAKAEQSSTRSLVKCCEMQSLKFVAQRIYSAAGASSHLEGRDEKGNQESMQQGLICTEQSLRGTRPYRGTAAGRSLPLLRLNSPGQQLHDQHSLPQVFSVKLPGSLQQNTSLTRGALGRATTQTRLHFWLALKPCPPLSLIAAGVQARICSLFPTGLFLFISVSSFLKTINMFLGSNSPLSFGIPRSRPSMTYKPSTNTLQGPYCTADNTVISSGNNNYTGNMLITSITS